MFKFLVSRCLSTLPVLLVVSVLVFLMLRLTLGDPAAVLAGDAASTEQIAQIRSGLGLDRSIPVQFGIWFGKLLTGDLGQSYYYKTEVITLIGQRLEPTLSLALVTISLAVLVAVPLGVLAASPASTAAGSPGVSRNIKNTNTETTSRTGKVDNKRLTRNLNIGAR